MTTIIGIKGKDPDFHEPYVLLLSDSKGSDGSFNNIKLYSPADANFSIGVAGKIFNNYFSKKDLGAQRLISGGKLEKNELEQILLELNNKMLDEIESKNNYVVGLQSSTPELLYLSDKGFMPAGRYFAQGSGREHTTTLNNLREYFSGDDLIIDKRKALSFGIDALKEASSKDKGTGGSASFSIITPKLIKTTYNHVSLE